MIAFTPPPSPPPIVQPSTTQPSTKSDSQTWDTIMRERLRQRRSI